MHNLKTVGKVAYDKEQAQHAVAWWKNLSESERARWSHAAQSLSPFDMRAAFNAEQTRLAALPKKPAGAVVEKTGRSVAVTLTEGQIEAIREMSLPRMATGQDLPKAHQFDGLYGALIRLQMAVKGD